ncbi:MAG: 50S ribosomal protein L21 [Minisyncoccota bacterium]
MAETKTKAKTATRKPKTAPKKASTKAVVSDTPKAPRTPKIKSSEFAVFATGGKQYQVSVGDSIKIEKILPLIGQANYKEGDKLVFENVLLVDDGTSQTSIGTPFIKGASINATLKKIGRYKTIDVIKYKQKSRYFKKNGHRQPYFEVTIDSIK